MTNKRTFAFLGLFFLVLSLNLNAQIPVGKWLVGPGIAAVSLPCCSPLSFFHASAPPIGFTVLIWQNPVDTSVDGYFLTVTMRDTKDPNAPLIVRTEFVLISNAPRGPIPYPRSGAAVFVAGRAVTLVSVVGQASKPSIRHVLEESNGPPQMVVE